MHKFKFAIALMLGVLLISGCPTNSGKSEAKAARDAAERAITAAKSAGAEQYAAEELQVLHRHRTVIRANDGQGPYPQQVKNCLLRGFPHQAPSS